MIRMKPLLTENTNAKTLYKIILNQTGYSDYHERPAADVEIDANRSSFGPIKKFVTKLIYGKKRANKEAADPEKVAELILNQLQIAQKLGNNVVTHYYNQLNDEFIKNWHGFKLPDYLDNVYEGKPRARKAFRELGDWVNSNTKDTWGLKYPYNDKWYHKLARAARNDDGMPDTDFYDSVTFGE